MSVFLYAFVAFVTFVPFVAFRMDLKHVRNIGITPHQSLRSDAGQVAHISLSDLWI